MNNKISFADTSYGRAFLKVIQALQGDVEYDGQLDAWLAALFLFAQAKQDFGRPAGTAPTTNYLNLSPAEYWARSSELIEQDMPGKFKLSPPARPAIHETVLTIVADHIRTHGCDSWDFSDSYWFLPREQYDMVTAISPEVADLIVDSFGDVRGKHVCCLFDGCYQLASKFAKHGANIFATVDNPLTKAVLRLMEKIHDTKNIRFVDPATVHDNNLNSYDIGISVPPFGMRAIPPGYESHPLDEPMPWPGQQHRVEFFAIRTLWDKVNQVAGRCAILVPPNVLFSTGQEQRFREFLLFELNAVDAVVNLPPRQITSTNLAAGVLFLDRHRDSQNIRLIDAGATAGIEKEGRAGIKIKSSAKIASLVRREIDDSEFATDLETSSIPGSDTSLHPPRYLSPVVLTGDKVPLKDVVEMVIRPPARPVGRDESQASEINITDLNEWGYVNKSSKTVQVRETKLQASRLRDDDVILSIKGSMGKVGIFHAPKNSLDDVTHVVSQSCIALRLSPEGKQKINPISLYMYLRSPIGKAALESLNVGAAIPHIQPAALLEQLEVPLLPMVQQEELEITFKNLMELQQEIRETQQKLEAIASTYWQIQ